MEGIETVKGGEFLNLAPRWSLNFNFLFWWVVYLNLQWLRAENLPPQSINF